MINNRCGRGDWDCGEVHDGACTGRRTGMMNETDKGAAASILLVDDDPMSQKVGRAMLAHFGCRVDVAGSGREAVDALSRQRYDMVFMDCQMPGMDGYEATGVIREREARKREGGDTVARIPIVALTGLATDEDRERCLRAGMDDYLSKPFSVAAVQSLLDRWLPARQDRAPGGNGRAGIPRRRGAEGDGGRPFPSRRAPRHRPEGPRGDRCAPAAGGGGHPEEGHLALSRQLPDADAGASGRRRRGATPMPSTVPPIRSNRQARTSAR